MKKLLLLTCLLSSLAFGRNIEDCRGFEVEKNEIQGIMMEQSKNLENFLDRPSIEGLKICQKSIKESELKVDHLIYYHIQELDVTSTYIVKHLKQIILTAEDELDKIEKKVNERE